MTCGQIVALAFTFLFCMAGVALMALSIGTDHWYEVPDTPSSPAYTFGLWRQCYTDTVPAGIPVEKLVGMNRTCVHREIIKQLESRLSQPDRLYMHLLRSHVGLICASCVLQFSTLLTLILGLWPANSCHCRSIRKVLVFRTGAVLSFLGSLLGMAGGICFIALRDLDEERREIPDAMASVRRDTALGMGSTTATVRQAALVGVGSGLYQWSFMVAWISTGLCYIQALILVYLCRFSDGSSDYYYTSKKYAM